MSLDDFLSRTTRHAQLDAHGSGWVRYRADADYLLEIHAAIRAAKSKRSWLWAFRLFATLAVAVLGACRLPSRARR